jgi:spore coat protein U-like protein
MLLGTPAQAATISQCRLNVTPMSFGSYNPFTSSDMRANGTVTYNCTVSGPIRIAMNRGGANSPLARRMVQGVTPLYYNLYLDAALTRIWGDRSFGTDFYSEAASRTNENVNIPVFGRIPAGQRQAKPGAYFDTVVVSIEF